MRRYPRPDTLRAIALCFALVAIIAHAVVAIPPLTARVTDLTGTLSAGERTALEETLAAFEQRKGSQIAVLIVPSTAPETVEQYALRVAESWKLGRKGVDDGALLLVAKDDRTLRIEVGYGLEGVIPDAIAKRIVSEIIVPRFRAGDFAGGIRAGVEQMIRLVDGEPLPPPAARSGNARDAWTLLPQLLIAAVVGGAVLSSMFGRFIGSGIAGSAAGIATWILFASILGSFVVGLVIFIFTLFGSMAGRGGYGGWSSGGGGWRGGGGGWGGGGGGGGGGFSGGGGGFGGGGASGRW